MLFFVFAIAVNEVGYSMLVFAAGESGSNPDGVVIFSTLYFGVWMFGDHSYFLASKKEYSQ